MSLDLAKDAKEKFHWTYPLKVEALNGEKNLYFTRDLVRNHLPCISLRVQSHKISCFPYQGIFHKMSRGRIIRARPDKDLKEDKPPNKYINKDKPKVLLLFCDSLFA